MEDYVPLEKLQKFSNPFQFVMNFLKEKSLRELKKFLHNLKRQKRN